jgi:hypothetical protein
MPTPKDHRDITIVVQPTAVSRQVVYELSYEGDTDGKVRHEVETDTEDTDASYRELMAFENGNLVLEVRAHLAVTVDREPGQIASKTVESQPQPPVDPSAPPQHPQPNAQQHVWAAAKLEVELVIEAATDLGPATVELRGSDAGVWTIAVRRFASGPAVAFGRLVMPTDVVKL